MRKFIAGSLLAASLGGAVITSAALAGSAGASTWPDPTCNPGTTAPTPLGDITVSGVNPSSPQTTGTLQVCAENSPVINGTVSASGNANPPGGYLVADGNNSNPGAGAGYIGVEGGSSGQLNVVGCAQGDYNNGSSSTPTGPNDGTTDGANGNNVIVGTSGNSLSKINTPPCGVTS